jgi:hypothetical protein
MSKPLFVEIFLGIREYLHPNRNANTQRFDRAWNAYGHSKRHQFLYQVMDSVDAKSGALLTHISLIIAALTFYYSLPDAWWIKTVLLVEIAIYLVLAILCLRCIMLKIPNEEASGSETETDNSGLEIELRRRELLYSFSIRATIFFTVILFLLILLHVGYSITEAKTHVLLTFKN